MRTLNVVIVSIILAIALSIWFNLHYGKTHADLLAELNPAEQIDLKLLRGIKNRSGHLASSACNSAKDDGVLKASYEECHKILTNFIFRSEVKEHLDNKVRYLLKQTKGKHYYQQLF